MTNGMVPTTAVLDQIAVELRKHFPSAHLSVEFPGTIHLYFEEITNGTWGTDRAYVMGDTNQTWMADYYEDGSALQNGQPTDSVDSHLPVRYTEPWLVALNLAAAIARYEQMELA